MFFSKSGEYTPCGMFGVGHYAILTLTLCLIGIAVFFTKKFNAEQVKNIIKKSTIVLWSLEVIKIIFNLAIGNARNPNNYIPLYYCSIILYAGIFSAYCKGKLKRMGDVFISTGAIIGGIFFLFCPNTSLPLYPLFHYISIQSFIFHGTMLYLGILLNITNYVNLNLRDIKYYAFIVAIVSGVSYIVNKLLGTNFMFISDNFPNTPIELVYDFTGKLFTPLMIILQVFGPFYVIYGIKKMLPNKKESNMQVA